MSTWRYAGSTGNTGRPEVVISDSGWPLGKSADRLTANGRHQMGHVEMAVDVTAITDRNATVASVELLDPCDGPVVSVVATATGSAKRDPSDRNNPAIGRDLAIGRALENLGRQLQRRADGQVRAASEAKRVRDEKAARAQAEADAEAVDTLHDLLQRAFEPYRTLPRIFTDER